MRLKKFIFSLFKDFIIKYTIPVNPNYVVRITEQHYDIVEIKSEFIITNFDKMTYGRNEFDLIAFTDYNKRRSISQITSEITQYITISKRIDNSDLSDHYTLSLLVAKKKQ